MSRINEATIYCPTNVKFEVRTLERSIVIWVSGEYGTWFYKINNLQYKISISPQKTLGLQTIRFYNIMKHYYTRFYKYSIPRINSQISLICIILKRMIVGAGVGFKRYLRVRGVGYKFELEDTLLKAKVGYTHSIEKPMPSEFYTRFSRKSKVIRFRSKSLTKLTGFLAILRSLRKPDIYKGKGIRYRWDPIRRKPGKRKTKAVSKKKKINTKQSLRKKVRKKRRRKKISFKKTQ